MEKPDTPENRGFRYSERIGPRASGVPVALYLAAHHRHSPEAVWRERLVRGEVLLDGERVDTETRLRTGQDLVWVRPPWREPAAPLDFSVLMEDEHILAVHKPPGLPTMAGGGFLENTLLYQVRKRYPAAAAVHRLGRWTSGVVLLARTSRARAHLSRGFRDRETVKRYRALGSGSPVLDHWVVETPIGRVPHPLIGYVHAASPDGVPARSEVTMLDRRSDVFLADVIIRTGRPHQVRIHMAASGHPLAGDPLYPAGGVPSPDTSAVPGDPGYLLHAAEIVFEHPGDGRRVRVTAPCPDWAV